MNSSEIIKCYYKDGSVSEFDYIIKNNEIVIKKKKTFESSICKIDYVFIEAELYCNIPLHYKRCLEFAKKYDIEVRFIIYQNKTIILNKESSDDLFLLKTNEEIIGPKRYKDFTLDDLKQLIYLQKQIIELTNEQNDYFIKEFITENKYSKSLDELRKSCESKYTTIFEATYRLRYFESLLESKQLKQ